MKVEAGSVNIRGRKGMDLREREREGRSLIMDKWARGESTLRFIRKKLER